MLPFPNTGSNSGSLVYSELHYQLSQTLLNLMAVLAYTIVFCTPMWMNTGTFRLIKYTLRSQKIQLSFQASLILIDADTDDISVTVRQMVKQTDTWLYIE